MSECRVIVDRLHDAFNARRFDVYPELLAEDVRLVLNGQTLQGAAALCDYVVVFVSEVQGIRVELERVIADSADTIVVQTRYSDASATPASRWGAWRLPVTLCETYRIVDGRIVEWRNYLGAELADQLSQPDVASWPGISQLVDEQSALRRVATLVASGPAPAEVFDTIVAETAELLGQETWLCRFETEDRGVVLAQHGAAEAAPQPEYVRMSGDGAVGQMRSSHHPTRVDSYAGLTGPGPDLARGLGVTATVAAPLLVQGTEWGALMVVSRGPRLAAGIEDRLAQFAELAGTAVANAQSRAELQTLADEQAALRRVAELVARGADVQEVFDEVTVEATRVLDDTATVLMRYGPSGAYAEIVAQSTNPEAKAWWPPGMEMVGVRIPVTGEIGLARVWRTGVTARLDDLSVVPGAEEIPIVVRGAAAVLAPIVVEGRLWGVLDAGSAGPPLPADTEERLERFCELIAAAIANVESRAALAASRARIVAAGDEARRRLARDVHDGAQQRQVHAIIALKQAQAALTDADGPVAGLVAESLAQVEAANAQLREMAHGILPAALARGGLRAGIESLLSHIRLPVETEVMAERLPERVETTAYFVIAEALTNVVKHAGADRARVRVLAGDDAVEVVVADDGRGGAEPANGSGLIGLTDRVDAAGGSLSLSSSPDAGTMLSVTLPIEFTVAGAP